MKKILFIFHDTNMTGASIILLRIIQNLVLQNKYDINIFLASTKGPMHELLAKYNIKLYAFDKKKEGNIFLKLWVRLIYFVRYTFALLHIRPDIVYANTLMNIGEVIIARIVNIYTLVHAHEGKNILQKYALFIRLADYFISEYIVISQYSLKSLQMFTHQKINKHIVYNGITIADKKIPSFGKDGIIKLSVVGTIDRNKSQLTAIQALEYLLQASSLKLHLNLFGRIADNDYYQELLEYINKKNLTNHVSFYGEILDQDKIYTFTDILLIASKDETLPLTVLEAFANCIPVIASNVGGLPEMVDHNTTGFLFETGNFKELSEQIIRLIKDDLLRHQIIENAYEKTIKKFDIDQTVEKISLIIDGKFNHVK